MCQDFIQGVVYAYIFPIVPAVHNQKSEWANLALLQPHPQYFVCIIQIISHLTHVSQVTGV